MGWGGLVGGFGLEFVLCCCERRSGGFGGVTDFETAAPNQSRASRLTVPHAPARHTRGYRSAHWVVSFTNPDGGPPKHPRNTRDTGVLPVSPGHTQWCAPSRGCTRRPFRTVASVLWALAHTRAGWAGGGGRGWEPAGGSSCWAAQYRDEVGPDSHHTHAHTLHGCVTAHYTLTKAGRQWQPRMPAWVIAITACRFSRVSRGGHTRKRVRHCWKGAHAAHSCDQWSHRRASDHGAGATTCGNTTVGVGVVWVCGLCGCPASVACLWPRQRWRAPV